MILWLLFAVASGYDQSCHDEGRCDASSMVQMKAGATQAIDCDGWVLAAPGMVGMCLDHCRLPGCLVL
jgi:hypothetical protein